MVWQIEVSGTAEKALSKLDKQTAKKITSYLREVAELEDPRNRGHALVGNLSGLWRYRIGDYRVICDIEDGVLVILVVDVDHRSKIYQRRKS